MKYIDLHCDALTAKGVSHVTAEDLSAGGCALQCFAAFVMGGNAPFERALELCNAFDVLTRGAGYASASSASDMGGGCGFSGNADTVGGERIFAMLTVENGCVLEGELSNLDALYARGVRMMTLVWNFPNELGGPAFPDYAAYAAGRVPISARNGGGGLTPFGREVVLRMAELGMLADLSHGSDRLVYDVASLGVPFVASHSGADAVYPCARNLTDRGIRAVANSGGVVGLDFCAAFLSDDPSPAGQREALLRHAAHILNVGGEDALALGSDFDGAPENAYLPRPSCMPRFLGDLCDVFGSRIAEKIACGNARRVFSSFLKP